MAENTPGESSEVLRSAWKRFAELDATADRLTKQHTRIRRWMAILGVIATFIAVFIEQMSNWNPFQGIEVTATVLRIILITLPITISVLAAYTNKFLGNGEWLTLRAAAEELLKEIYLYRTILQWHPDRDRWLSLRMTTILRRVYKSMSGQLVLNEYDGTLPPYYSPDDPNSDPGFDDLDGDEYMHRRLINQRDWHRRRIQERQRERKRTQFTILAMGGFGALFAALAGPWIAWVAVTAAIASALTGWEQMRGLDETIQIYSRVILELTIIRDEWESVPAKFRAREHFVKMVRGAEGVMWAQSQKYVATMQEALSAADGDDAKLIDEMISVGNETVEAIQAKLYAESADVMRHTRDRVVDTVDQAGTSVKGMVDTLADESLAYTDLAESTVDKAVAESEAYREAAGRAVDNVMDESAAVRASMETAGSAVMEDVDAARESMEAAVISESRAYLDTTDEILDEALSESEAIRESAKAASDAVIEDVDAVRENMETAVKSESQAYREATDEIMDEALAESEALRKSADAVSREVVEDVGAVRETVESTIAEEAAAIRASAEASAEALQAGSEALREAAESSAKKTADEMEAMSDTLEQSADTLTAESAAVRATIEDISDATAAEMEAVRSMSKATADRILEESAWLRARLEEAGGAAEPQVMQIRAAIEEALTARAAASESPEDYLQNLPDADEVAREIIEQGLDENAGMDEELQKAIENVFRSGDESQQSMIDEALSGLVEGDTGEDEAVKG